eukprot:221737_1
MNTTDLILLINILQKSQTLTPIQPPQQPMYTLNPINQLPMQNTNPIFLTNIPIAANKATNITQDTNNPKTVNQTIKHCVKLEKNVCTCFKKNVNTRSVHPTSRNKYKCDICFKSFYIKNDMIMHKTIHVGNNPYQYVCTICHTSYRSKVAKNNHMKKIHPLIWNIWQQKRFFIRNLSVI